MSLIPEQEAFLLDWCRLIQYAKSQGYVVTAGELQRPLEMQQIYLKTGRSKTMNTMHLKRCAGDLNIFKNGKLCTRDEIKPLGDYWESLHPKNRWGGNWRGAVDRALAEKRAAFIDAPHFERLV